MNSINTNAVNVVNEQWDYLIVLDACRYDYFERQYGKHLKGELKKNISPGSSTPEWRDNAFPGKYDDIVYISSNPMLSSNRDVYGYNAGEHFREVFDVWKDGWDSEKGTVMPETVTKAAIDIIGRNPGNRFVIHYLQPHAPYVGKAVQSKGHASGEEFGKGLSCFDQSKDQTPFRTRLIKKLAPKLRKTKLLGNHPEWFLRKSLAVPPVTPLEVAWRQLGKHGMRKAYEANLELVLEHVAVLIEHLSGRIVITADHGELLGENRCYGHPPKSVDPIQSEVPWLVIKKKDKIIRKATDATAKSQQPVEEDTSEPAEKVDQEVIERLRALGYYD